MIKRMIERLKLWIYKKYFVSYHYEYVRIREKEKYERHHEAWDLVYSQLVRQPDFPLVTPPEVRYDRHASDWRMGLINPDGTVLKTWTEIGKGDASDVYNCSQFTAQFEQYKNQDEETV